jgi:hypothetical protein
MNKIYQIPLVRPTYVVILYRMIIVTLIYDQRIY